MKSPATPGKACIFWMRDDPGVNIRFGEDFLRRIKETEMPRMRSKLSDMPFNSVAENAFDLSGLRRMIKTAKEHDVELVLFAYPQHVYSEELG